MFFRLQLFTKTISPNPRMKMKTETMKMKVMKMKALSPSIKDIKESTMMKLAPASSSTGGEEHDDVTHKPENKSHQETVTTRQPTDPSKLGNPSLLMEDVGEIDIDGEEDDEDSVGFHPIDAASIFRARPEVCDRFPRRNCATTRSLVHGGETPLSHPICKAVSKSQDIDSSRTIINDGDEETVAPPPTMQPGLLTTSNTGSNNHATSYCEASQVTNTSQSPFSVSPVTELREGVSSSPHPSDVPSIIVLPALQSASSTTTKTTTTTTTSAFSLFSSPSRPDSDSDATIATITSAPGPSGSKRGLDDTMVAPQQHAWKRHKDCSLPRHPKPEQEQKGNAMKMACHGHCGFEELLPCGDTPGAGHHHHPPSLLEIAVGYGYHLARCRMMVMNETPNAELSGILDPSRRVQEILEHGAQTVVRMKDQERLLFWKYMSESPILQKTRARTTAAAAACNGEKNGIR